MFSKTKIDFGDVFYQDRAVEVIKYLGTNELTNANFTKGCSCTAVDYNPVTKELTLTLNADAGPIKYATVTANIPEGQYIIQMQLTLKQR